eukprot:2916818-Pleurochrysis_carterae.AAC.2
MVLGQPAHPTEGHARWCWLSLGQLTRCAPRERRNSAQHTHARCCAEFRQRVQHTRATRAAHTCNACSTHVQRVAPRRPDAGRARFRTA